MATITTTKIAVNLKLNNGTTETGNIKTLNVSMGKINQSSFDPDKALVIGTLIGACLTKAVLYIEKVDTAIIDSGE